MWHLGLAGLLLVWFAGPALGNPKQEAREHARRGSVAYNLGNYEEAAHYYEQAYRLVQDANLLFNIAQAYRLAGKPDKALAAYKGFLRTAAPDHGNRAVAEQHARELEGTARTAEPARPAPSSGAPARDGKPPGGGEPDPFNPYAAPAHESNLSGVPVARPREPAPEPAGQEAQGTRSDLLQRLNPTFGGLLGFANQRGFESGTRARFQLFARTEHNGHRYELGYFRLPLFAPNPMFTTSALYLRFRSRDDWYAQAGLLGENGDFHGAGGLEWKFLALGAQVQRVGSRALCNGLADDAAVYVVPELQVALPVVRDLRALAYGSLRHAVVQTDGCAFAPTMSTLSLTAEWDFDARWLVRAGLDFHRFFGERAAVGGSWPSMDPAGALHAGARYRIGRTLALSGSYRRIQYEGGVNELIFGGEFGLGDL